MTNLNITLRPWNEEKDLDNMVHLANNPRIAERLMNRFPHPYSIEDGKRFIQSANASDPPHVLAIDLLGQAIGGIGVHPLDDVFAKNAEMGYWLGEPFWNKGYGSLAIKMMIRYAFDHLPIQRIFARPFGTNTASQRVLEKCGFQLEARLKDTVYKNGKYDDELIYAVRR
ncbi:MAG: GNAT family N-acetyltransferase [Saprospiraceae bacterium]|nr:GNAT family N-acetyltransferase [Saprospiraceae bacterium]HMX89495.1 GNAT family protein [Saprospiraceae bacterium]HMZ40877.1 GNAT family protein [Saprospiraceae bacterium]HNA64025.1 GNAT family protein [Saprospiraceae bacterium]HNB31154.1 GNAT family protein [Saprospiraceae bacterium]